MKNYWLLNFEHDLALASNMPYYMPPKVATAMNEDMGPLPFWLDKDAYVLTTRPKAGIGIETCQVMESLGIDVKFVYRQGFEVEAGANSKTWGWDAQSAQQLTNLGFNIQQDIPYIREWSHRSKTILFLQKFVEEGLFPAEMLPREAHSTQEIEEWTTAQKLILKSPLSGSGRGIWWALNGCDFNVQRWSKRAIETQRSIMCEPIWEKTGDFAMEFECANGKTTFAGYSQFMADNAGVYRCNLLLPDQKIAETLASKIGEKTLERIKQTWIKLLDATIATKYNGIVGVDMLTGIHNGYEMLHPCVEINLRMTMGMAARKVYDLWVDTESTGEFRTIHFKNEGELKRHACEMSQKFPVTIKNGKIKDGYVLLTRGENTNKYGIEIEIKPKE